MSLLTNQSMSECRLCRGCPTVTADYLCQTCADRRDKRRWAWAEEDELTPEAPHAPRQP